MHAVEQQQQVTDLEDTGDEFECHGVSFINKHRCHARKPRAEKLGRKCALQKGPHAM